MPAGSTIHRSPRAAACVVMLALGCQARDERAAGAPAEPTVTVRDPSGATVLEARLTGGRCETAGAIALTVARAGDRVTATGAQTLEMIPAGDSVQITANGAARARLHRVGAPARVDLIDPIGVPIARIAVTDAAATVADPSRAPVAKLRRDGGRIVVDDGGGAALAYVHGTTDLEVAAHLVAPGVPAELRALLGCERLLAPAEPAPDRK